MVSWAQEEGLVAWNGMVLTLDPSQTDMAIPKISQWWPSFDPRIVSWAEEGGWWPEMDAATQPSRLQTFTRSPPSLPPFVNFISFHISHDGEKSSKKKYEQILTNIDRRFFICSELWVTLSSLLQKDKWLRELSLRFFNNENFYCEFHVYHF